MRLCIQKKIKKGALLVLFILCSIINVGAEEAKLEPVIVIPESVFDFHEVKEGTLLEHSFGVYNKGQQPLEIQNVKPG